MRHFLRFAALIGTVLVLGACAVTPAGEPMQASNAALQGTWEGTWTHKQTRQPFPMSISFNDDRANYWVRDNDGKEYRFNATYSVKDVQVILVPNVSFERIDTYTLYKTPDGELVLNGVYTVDGKPRADVKLTKQ
jgi:hypothetical protein